VTLIDAHNRKIRDLRLSVTDRCNFRCFYCLPHGGPPLARRETIMTFEELALAAEIFVDLGIEKIRLTGGEPLLRKDLPKLTEMIARLKPRLKDLALTTNGFDLPKHATALKDSGLDRVTISLDSLDRDNFHDITGVDAIDKVFEAIETAKKFEFEPIKINAVIVRGRNDHEVADLAKFARKMNVKMRFIEFMPLDSGHEWDREMVVSGREIYKAIDAVYPLELIESSRGNETAWKYRFADGAAGEIGIIAPVTEMFCGACSRIRLTADGQIRTCLFSTVEHNLRDKIRSGKSHEDLADFIRGVTLQKEARHHINDADFIQPSRTMSFIGG
jgi:cyclic pyranopterin phosphate synthase